MIYPQVVEETSGEKLVKILSIEETYNILELVVNSSDTMMLGEVHHQPGQILASLDPVTEQHIGLHIDNWDKHPFKDRPQSSVRFAVNGGPGLRGLWIGPAIYDFSWLQNEIPSVAGFGSARIDCKLVPVPPYCGYLARTEELIHDGTTILATQESKLTTWLVPPGSNLYDKLSDMIGEVSGQNPPRKQ